VAGRIAGFGEAGLSSMAEKPKLRALSALSGLGIAVGVLCIVASFGCGNQSAPASHEEPKREQVLPLMLGGWLKGGPEAEMVDGVCGTDYTRNVLICDIYNGLPGWTLSEVTLSVAWSPYKDGDSRIFQVPVTIKPRTTERVTVGLGLRLPPDDKHWAWQNVGAKGYPAN
jgi:hypothetical protein